MKADGMKEGARRRDGGGAPQKPEHHRDMVRKTEPGWPVVISAGGMMWDERQSAVTRSNQAAAPQ